MSKKTLSESRSQTFNSHVLIWGAPGTGKTTFAGSYTKGPTHFYSFDPQGTEVLLNEGRTDITVDDFSDGVDTIFSSFWKQAQEDEQSGFFQEMADNEGLVVFDSYTTLENRIVKYTMKHVLAKKGNKDGLFIPEEKDWRTITGYVLAFFSWCTSLPCASLVIVHRKSSYNHKEGISYYTPSILGQQSEGAMRWFSDCFYCYMLAGSQFLQVKGVPTAPSASRMIPKSVDIQKLKNPSMDDFYLAFHEGPKSLKNKIAN